MTALRNGYLPDSVLAPIFAADGKTVVGRLEKEAAAAWNAMCAYARAQGLPTPIPDGPASSYRTFAQQVEQKAEWTAKGEPQNAATPGESNHGWGLAVDSAPNDGVHHGEVVDQIGARFGFSKAWSDAPWEPWHHKYKSGVWAPKLFTPDYKRGSKGPMVLLVTQRLVDLGYLTRRWWHFDVNVENAVKKFQRDHHYTPDGVVGPATWAAIKRLAGIVKHSAKHPPARKPRKPIAGGNVGATKISKPAVKAIAGFEGGQGPDGLYHPYFDRMGNVWTQGFGHTKGVTASSKPWTAEHAMAVLEQDLNEIYVPAILAAAKKYGWRPLTQDELDALASFGFNLGNAYFTPLHTLGAALQKHDLAGAAAAFLLYDKDANGVVEPGLQRRRKWEETLFQKH